MTAADSRGAVEHFLGAYREDPDDTVIEAIGADRVLTVGHLRDLVRRPVPDPSVEAFATAPEPRPGHGPGVPGAMHLEAFGQSIADAFGHVPYHVGSSATSKTWRDVDVRLILDDDQFHALFPGFAAANHIDAWWSLLCAALSELGRVRTGLPIDFQIQSMTEANAKHHGIRNPLMLIRARDEHRPAMAAPQHVERGCGHVCSEMHTYEPGQCEAAVERSARDGDDAPAELVDAETGLDDLRTQLGEPGEEWRFDDGHGWFTVSRKPLSDTDVQYLRKQTGRPVEHRIVGEWHEVGGGDA